MVKAVMNGGDMDSCVYGLLAPQEAFLQQALFRKITLIATVN